MTKTPDEPTDEELLERSLSGDETAFDRLFIVTRKSLRGRVARFWHGRAKRPTLHKTSG